MTTRCMAVSFVAAVLAATAPARADDVSGAAKAFSQAQEAMLGGDPARAADLYELADELAPSAPALRNATRARVAAGHTAMAATNAATLLRRYPSDKESRDIAEAVLSQLAPQLAQLEVTCTAACTLLLDGKVVASVARSQHSLFAQPGARTVTAVFGDNRQVSRQITAAAQHTATVSLAAPPSPARTAGPIAVGNRAPRSAGRNGLSRWWVAGGAVTTLGVGAATAMSGMATLSTRNDIRTAVAADDDAGARRLYDTGRDQQRRTNVLLGVTAAAGLGTVVLAIFTRWSSDDERHVAVVPTHGGLSVGYAARF
jgi:hypothetical protein